MVGNTSAVIPRRGIQPIFPRTSCLFDETWLADSRAAFQREIHSPAGVNLASALAALVLPGVVHEEWTLRNRPQPKSNNQESRR
jgi:hypothetical protein